MLIAAVYSKRQKIRRRLILLNHDCANEGQFQPHKDSLHKGEGWLDIPLEIYEQIKEQKDTPILDNYIASQIGEPLSDKCHVICEKRGKIAEIHADPDIDFHPEGKIVEVKE